MKFGIAGRPYPGEMVSGDACFIEAYDNQVLIGVVDGLGHGQGAFWATQQATRYLEAHYREGLTKIIRGCHEALKGTRGVVIGLALIDHERSTLTHAGVGNIQTRVVGVRSVSFGSVPGIVGDNVRKITEEVTAYSPGDLVILSSDGISDRFDLGDYPGLIRKEPQQIADAIFRDYARENDDALIVVVR